MKRRTILTSTLAALGAGLVAATALAQQPANPPNPPAANTRPQISAEDRAAMIDARIAGIKAGLKLTPDQEKLWPPVEAAARDMAKQAQDTRAARGTQGQTDDPVERMARMGEQMTQRGTAMVKVATAARPLYASLSDDQKRRLRMLMHPAGMERGERGNMMGGRHGDHERMGHHRDHHGWNEHR
jgi:hypothetical protein